MDVFNTYDSKPEFVLEVGTFVGSSAIKIGRYLQRRGCGTLLCVDPFTGAGEMWFTERFRNILSFKAGQPRIYERWMENIIINSKETCTCGRSWSWWTRGNRKTEIHGNRKRQGERNKIRYSLRRKLKWCSQGSTTHSGIAKTSER